MSTPPALRTGVVADSLCPTRDVIDSFLNLFMMIIEPLCVTLHKNANEHKEKKLHKIQWAVQCKDPWEEGVHIFFHFRVHALQ